MEECVFNLVLKMSNADFLFSFCQSRVNPVDYLTLYYWCAIIIQLIIQDISYDDILYFNITCDNKDSV